MKFTLFRQEFSKRELELYPELSHLDFKRFYWKLVRKRLQRTWLYIIPFVLIALLCPPFGLLVFVPLIFTGYDPLARPFYRVHTELLREQRVFFCSSFECRYNCTGIRGNRCPECGAVVPGLVSE